MFKNVLVFLVVVFCVGSIFAAGKPLKNVDPLETFLDATCPYQLVGARGYKVILKERTNKDAKVAIIAEVTLDSLVISMFSQGEMLIVTTKHKTYCIYFEGKDVTTEILTDKVYIK